MIHAGLKRLDEDFEALVIANQAVNFSVGANLMLLLVSAQEQEWDDIHLAVRQFQRVNMAIKYAPARWWSRRKASRWAAVAKSRSTLRRCKPPRNAIWAWWKPA